jgi:hypothetical protein
MPLALEIHEVTPAVGGLEDDVAAVAAVAAVGPTLGDELLPPKADAPMPAPASPYFNFCAIVKQNKYFLLRGMAGMLPAPSIIRQIKKPPAGGLNLSYPIKRGNIRNPIPPE